MKNSITILFVLIFILTACEQEDKSFDLGLDLVESKSTISLVDSFQVRLSTVRLDSISTSGTDILLVGEFESETTGSIEINSYFNFDKPTALSEIEEDAIFDSITIQLHYADYAKGDTIQTQSIDVYRLTEQLQLQENDYSQQYLFNTSSFQTENVPCGHHEFIYQSENEYIEFRLADELGEEFYALSQENNADELVSNSNFLEFLKGFVLKQGANAPKSILGFASDSVSINMYLHTVEFETVETTVQLSLSTEDSHFNGIKTDRSNTSFANLSDQREELNSTSTENVSFIQGTAGVIVRIDFPSLNNIFSFSDRVLLKAELILRPSPESYLGEMPTSLNFYETDRVNEIGDQLTYTSSSTEYSLTASLHEDDLYNENSYYIVDISDFISSALSGNYYDINNGLLVTVPYSDLATKADHLILEGEIASREKPTLNLYFLTFE